MMKLADYLVEFLVAMQVEVAVRYLYISVWINRCFVAFSGLLDSVTTLQHLTVRPPPPTG
jgi:hypothetical protein